MACPKCSDTGWFAEYEPETGFVDIPCPWCVGIDGEQPDRVTEAQDAATQAEIDDESVTSRVDGCLRMALGYLVKGHKTLLAGTQSITLYMVGEAICRADGSVRHALELLKEEQER